MTATCAALEVSESKFHEWIKKGEQGEEPYAEFRQRTLCARAWGKIAIVRRILADRDRRAPAWYLGRCHPSEYGRTAERPLPPEPEMKRVSVAFIFETSGKSVEELTNLPGKRRVFAPLAGCTAKVRWTVCQEMLFVAPDCPQDHA